MANEAELLALLDAWHEYQAALPLLARLASGPDPRAKALRPLIDHGLYLRRWWQSRQLSTLSTEATTAQRRRLRRLVSGPLGTLPLRSPKRTSKSSVIPRVRPK